MGGRRCGGVVGGSMVVLAATSPGAGVGRDERQLTSAAGRGAACTIVSSCTARVSAM